LPRFGVNSDQKGQIVRIFCRELVTIHSGGPTNSSPPHIEDIIKDACEEIHEVVGRASGLGLDESGKVGDRSSEDFAAGSLTGRSQGS
jgi:hypothetical protein